MRYLTTLCLTLALAGGLRADDRGAAIKPRLELGDEGLPLTELRPNDRHVYVLTLDGKWTNPAVPGVVYYVNVLFPNGRAASHRVLNDVEFRRGDVPVLFQETELRNNLPGGRGTTEVVVSANRGVTSAG